MRSRFFQLRFHQSHSTLPFSQTEFAFYLDPFALVPVTLNLVLVLSFFGPSQSWPGQPDSPLSAVAEILSVVYADMCFIPKVPGITLLDLMGIRISFLFLILGRRWGRNDYILLDLTLTK